MRKPRIYHPQTLQVGTDVVLSENACSHVLKVLRLRPGDALTLFDGNGAEFSAQLMEQSKNWATVKVLDKNEVSVESPLQIHLAQGLCRSEKMDYVIQKSVELGVVSIVPILTERVTVKLSSDRAEKKIQHWQSKIIHACEQCGRNIVPRIGTPKPLVDWMKTTGSGTKFILSPTQARKLSEFSPATPEIYIAIGPEGGFSESEIQSAEQNNLYPLQLGPRISRTETAAVATLSALQTLWGGMN